jgi:hypothetical protein
LTVAALPFFEGGGALVVIAAGDISILTWRAFVYVGVCTGTAMH